MLKKPQKKPERVCYRGTILISFLLSKLLARGVEEGERGLAETMGGKKKKRISKEPEEEEEQRRGWRRRTCSTAELRVDNPAWEGRALTEATDYFWQPPSGAGHIVPDRHRVQASGST